MHRMTIQYAVPDDPAAFDQRYTETHVPLVAQVPGLRDFTWSKVVPMGGDRSVYLVAQLDFDDRESMMTALATPQMSLASDDADAFGVPRTAFSGEVRTARSAPRGV